MTLSISKLKTIWSKLTELHHPHFVLPWRNADTRNTKLLVSKHGHENVERLFYYVHERWAERTSRFPDPPPAPNLAWVTSMEKWLVPEASEYWPMRELWLEVKSWRQHNPNKLLPDEIERRYAHAREKLESLGALTEEQKKGKHTCV